VKALGGAGAKLRREVTQRVGLRSAPELKFFFDSGQDAITRIEELLEEVKRGK
jgi:ribosome-binding factor A